MLSIVKKIMNCEARMVVDAPLDRVFSYVADFSGHGQWSFSPAGASVEKTSEGPLAVGTTFMLRRRVEGQTTEGSEWGYSVSSQLTVTEFERDRRLSFDVETRSFGMSNRYRHSFDLRPMENGVEVTQRAEWIEMNSPMQSAILVTFPIAVPALLFSRWWALRKMRRLKALLTVQA